MLHDLSLLPPIQLYKLFLLIICHFANDMLGSAQCLWTNYMFVMSYINDYSKSVNLSLYTYLMLHSLFNLCMHLYMFLTLLSTLPVVIIISFACFLLLLTPSIGLPAYDFEVVYCWQGTGIIQLEL